jgi:hypothetical protein
MKHGCNEDNSPFNECGIPLTALIETSNIQGYYGI